MNRKKKIIIISVISFCLVIGSIALLVINNKTNNKKKIDCIDFTGGSYNLIFNTDGGNEIKSMTICIACSPDSYDDIPVPTKEGSIFDGWYYDETFKKKVSETSTGTINPIRVNDKNGCLVSYKDINLYAKWNDSTNGEKDENNKPSGSPTAYCDDGYTMSDNKCIRTEIIAATKVEKCPDGYHSEGKGLCINLDGGVGISSLHCGDGSVGPDARENCLINPNELSQDQCSYNGGHWFNGVCYSNTTSPLCPDGSSPNMHGDQNGITYFCDNKERYATGWTEYSCPDGYTINDTKCYRTTTTDVKYR